MTTDRRTRLAATFVRYADEARTRAAAIPGLLQDGKLRDALIQAHTLAGSGATVGADDISDQARIVEAVILAAMDQNRPLTDAELADLALKLPGLQAAVAGFDPDTMLDAFMERMFPNG